MTYTRDYVNIYEEKYDKKGSAPGEINVKKLICILLAVTAAAAICAGCLGKKQGDSVTDIGTNPTPVTTATAPTATPDPRTYDNSAYADGTGIQTGAFNWNYFKAKVMAGYNGELRVCWDENGARVEKLLVMKAKKLSLEGDGREFAYLCSSVAGKIGENGVRVYFLSNEEDMTLARLIGVTEGDLASGLPVGAGMGFSNDRGVIVMIEKAED